ncbi:hypothetical protein FSARC_4762 [Fusarium sarcochroum]|uniref:Cupin type-2 domain-containing protein n=1 Tax=Fusarium sarcochroum TaxID=1208366 RepID=A0A8H4U135_9HYPO|nr:hypothetical protein FSARC_4762 [Fusarium sarcochroum]
MSFQPLFFLRGSQPTRTSNWNKNSTVLPDTLGRSFSLSFTSDEQNIFYNTQAFPAHDKEKHSEPTLYHPPPHYHLWTDEYFHVTSGSGTWHFWDKSVHLSKGDDLRVPRWAWHWFEGDPSSDDPLITRVRYNKGNAAMEERFFRNTLSYLGDCHREGVQFGVCQLMIFFLYAEIAPGLRIVRFERLNMILNVLIMYILAGIGLLMGYQASYEEYYLEGGNKKRD